jgi:hypothetical protein
MNKFMGRGSLHRMDRLSVGVLVLSIYYAIATMDPGET